MTVAEFLAKDLAERGINYLFGVPGGPSIPYIEAFNKNGIRFILTSTETGAGVMADVTGRLTGLPGICHSTFGPGATNLATGIGGALLDRSPVIAFTSEVPDSLKKRTVQMNIDHQALFEPLTKATTRLNQSNCAPVISDAFDLTRSEYPGPVHIGLPSDLAGMNVKSQPADHENGDWLQEISIDSEVADLLQYTRKPLLAIGLTAARKNIGPDILQFLDQHPMPVVVTPMAKGVIPSNHECYAGVLFHACSDRLTDLIEESDLVIGLGYDPVEYNYESWLHDIPLVHINTTATDMPKRLPVKQVICDLDGILNLISPVLRNDNDWELSIISETRQRLLSALETGRKTFGPVKVLKTMQKVCSPDTILTLDVGSHIHLFGQFWDPLTNKNLLLTNGWSGMGFGIPAAIAAKLAFSNNPVVCVTGDGGFLMSGTELMTAKRLGLNITVVVLNDGELNLIKLKQAKQGSNFQGTDLSRGDLFGASSFLSVQVRKVTTQQGFKKALSESLASDGPQIINAVIDPSDYKDLVVV